MSLSFVFDVLPVLSLSFSWDVSPHCGSFSSFFWIYPGSCHTLSLFMPSFSFFLLSMFCPSQLLFLSSASILKSSFSLFLQSLMYHCVCHSSFFCCPCFARCCCHSSLFASILTAVTLFSFLMPSSFSFFLFLSLSFVVDVSPLTLVISLSFSFSCWQEAPGEKEMDRNIKLLKLQNTIQNTKRMLFNYTAGTLFGYYDYVPLG